MSGQRTRTKMPCHSPGIRKPGTAGSYLALLGSRRISGLRLQSNGHKSEIPLLEGDQRRKRESRNLLKSKLTLLRNQL